MLLQNILPFAHCLLRKALPEGGNALDGTAGNGHDTLFLAQTAGIRGKVWAFDIQPQALSRTRCRLKEARYENVQLILDGHENLKQYVSEPLNAAIFNFGWLPGGDKSLTTHTETSIPALCATLSLLKEGGMLSCRPLSGTRKRQTGGRSNRTMGKKPASRTVCRFALRLYQPEKQPALSFGI